MIIDLIDLDSNSEKDVIAWLMHQDDLYENEGDSDVNDDVYDRVRRWASVAFSANKYFTGVGADVRGGKIRLPYGMSGLTQVYEGGDTEKWAKKTNADEYVISDKLDGTSAQVIYDADGDLQIAYSRGNGTEGADITRHIKRIKNIPNKIPAPGRTFPVRMEIEFRISDWGTVQSKFSRRGGEKYKNGRNAVAGIMNASKNDDDVYNYLRGIAYTVIESKMDKTDQLELLEEYGFEVARYTKASGAQLTDENLTRFLEQQRKTTDYEIDGIVININKHKDLKKADKAGQPHAVKYKVADASNFAVTVVKDVVYRASKDGYLKPRVNVKPVNLVGVTVNFATGFNAKFIKDNGIGPGAKIRITRSGDVIPFILGTVEAATPAMPDADEHGEWKWSVNEVDAVLVDTGDNRDVAVRRNVDIFTKLSIAHLKEGNLEKLYDAGFKTVQDIINADYTDLYINLGEVGAKIDDSMDEKLNGIYWPEFVGSLNVFGRGISRRKLTALYDAFKGDVEKMRDINAICKVEGFDEKTGRPIVNNIDKALAMIDEMSGRVTLKTYTKPTAPKGSKMKDQAVVFTGVRSAEAEQKIIEEGGEIKSGISAKVTILVCKDVNSNSGKAKKARQMGIKIMDLKSLEKMLYS